MAQSSIEASSSSLYSATNELSIASLKAKTASGLVSHVLSNHNPYKKHKFVNLYISINIQRDDSLFYGDIH